MIAPASEGPPPPSFVGNGTWSDGVPVCQPISDQEAELQQDLLQPITLGPRMANNTDGCPHLWQRCGPSALSAACCIERDFSNCMFSRSGAGSSLCCCSCWWTLGVASRTREKLIPATVSIYRCGCALYWTGCGSQAIWCEEVPGAAMLDVLIVYKQILTSCLQKCDGFNIVPYWQHNDVVLGVHV